MEGTVVHWTTFYVMKTFQETLVNRMIEARYSFKKKASMYKVVFVLKFL